MSSNIPEYITYFSKENVPFETKMKRLRSKDCYSYSDYIAFHNSDCIYIVHLLRHHIKSQKLMKYLLLSLHKAPSIILNDTGVYIDIVNLFVSKINNKRILEDLKIKADNILESKNLNYDVSKTEEQIKRVTYLVCVIENKLKNLNNSIFFILDS